MNPGAKRLLARLAVFSALQAGALAVILGSFPEAPGSYLAGAIDKGRLLATTPAPRLIVVGGSAAAFSHDSESLLGAGLRPVNMALHANLGLELMFAEVRSALEPGDVVLIIPEYQHWQGVRPSATVLRRLAHQPRDLALLPVSYYAPLLDAAHVYVGYALKIAAQRALGLREGDADPYARRFFDEYGDLDLPAGISAPGYTPSDFRLGRLTEASLETTARLLDGFAAECRDRGVRVFAVYPPLPTDLYEKHAEALLRIDRFARSRLSFPVLGEPRDFVQPPESFFDTFYHLTVAGRAARARKVRALLLPRLQGQDGPGR